MNEKDWKYEGEGKRKFLDKIMNGWINWNIDGMRIDIRYRKMGGKKIIEMNIGEEKEGEMISGDDWREEE